MYPYTAAELGKIEDLDHTDLARIFDVRRTARAGVILADTHDTYVFGNIKLCTVFKGCKLIGRREKSGDGNILRNDAVGDILHPIKLLAGEDGADVKGDNIIAKMEGGDKLTIHTTSAGEDWKAFESYIEATYQAENRREVLAILRMNASIIQKERYIHALDAGKTWRLLTTKFMGSARNATVVRIVEEKALLDDRICWSVKPAELIPPLRFEYKTNTEIVELRKPVVAIRSNLLVPALNFGVEVPIGNNWSVGADYYYPWVWPKRDNKNCFELLAWGIEGRYWFGKERTVFDRLRGHSIGLYGYMGYYDFERNFHGHQGEFVNVGVDYTYAMAVGKKKSVHFEFSIGLGFIYSQARQYSVIEANGPLISNKITKSIGFFGPTKANISLVVPIFQRVKPNDKEVRR